MDPVTALTVGKEIIEQIRKYQEYFTPFKPGIRTLVLNYADGSARIDLAIYAPLRGRFGKKVEIPSSERFSLIEMYDHEFNRISGVWERTDHGWVLKAKSLPQTSENFLVSLQGAVSPSGLRDFVEVTVPSSPLVGQKEDKYWLHCALRSPGTLQSIYEALEVDKVNLNVKVVVNRCFSTSIPHEIRTALGARANLLKSMSSGDRNVRKKAERSYRMAHKVSKASEVDILRVIAELISREHVREFMKASDPYRLGTITPDEGRITPIPENVVVDAFTNLNYAQKAATGELVFERERYKETIRNRMKKLME